MEYPPQKKNTKAYRIAKVSCLFGIPKLKKKRTFERNPPFPHTFRTACGGSEFRPGCGGSELNATGGACR